MAANFDINQHLQQAGFGRGGGAADDEFKANEQESPEIIVAGINKWGYVGVKLVGAIPIIGEFLSSLLPANPGKVSAFAGFESPEGLVGKQIRPGSGGPQGGILAKIAGELVKNSAITDHTVGVGLDGGAGGGGDGAGGGGDGGGGSSGGESGNNYSFESYATNSGMGEMFIAAGGGNQFDYSDVPRSMLGDLRPSMTPSLVGGQGMGMDLG